MKILAYLPHHIELPAELISGFDRMAEFRILSKDVAMARVPGTRRWLVLYNDGAGFLAIGYEGKRPTLADVIRTVKNQEVAQ